MENRNTHPSEIDMATIYTNKPIDEKHMAALKKSFKRFNKK